MSAIQATDGPQILPSSGVDVAVGRTASVTLPVIMVASTEVLSSAQRYVALRLRNLPDILTFRQYFASVEVERVEIEWFVRAGNSRRISVGLLPSNANVPTEAVDVLRYPGLSLIISDTRTATGGVLTFSRSNVHGVEWDLAQEAIRSGHPIAFIGWTGTLVEQNVSTSVASAAVRVHLRVGGAASGAPLGGQGF